MASYRDRWIECTDEAIRIRGYYFPWGTKTIPYTSIRSVRRVDIGTLTGKARIWGRRIHAIGQASILGGRAKRSD